MLLRLGLLHLLAWHQGNVQEKVHGGAELTRSLLTWADLISHYEKPIIPMVAKENRLD